MSLPLNGARHDDSTRRWLIVRMEGEEPQLAVALPVGQVLAVGNRQGCWLRLSADGIGPRHAELELRSDQRISVRHVEGDAGTWINRARILSGFLKEGDVLRIGPYGLTLATHAAVRAGCGEVEVGGREAPAAEDEPGWRGGPAIGEAAVESPWTLGRRVWAIGCVAVIVLAGWLLIRRFVWTGSAEMPTETVYSCPVDGTLVRAAWGREPPRCPKCGQACFGSPTQRVAILRPPAATSGPASQSARGGGGR